VGKIGKKKLKKQKTKNYRRSSNECGTSHRRTEPAPAGPLCGAVEAISPRRANQKKNGGWWGGLRSPRLTVCFWWVLGEKQFKGRSASLGAEEGPVPRRKKPVPEKLGTRARFRGKAGGGGKLGGWGGETIGEIFLTPVWKNSKIPAGWGGGPLPKEAATGTFFFFFSPRPASGCSVGAGGKGNRGRGTGEQKTKVAGPFSAPAG